MRVLLCLLGCVWCATLSTVVLPHSDVFVVFFQEGECGPESGRPKSDLRLSGWRRPANSCHVCVCVWWGSVRRSHAGKVSLLLPTVKPLPWLGTANRMQCSHSVVLVCVPSNPSTLVLVRLTAFWWLHVFVSHALLQPTGCLMQCCFWGQQLRRILQHALHTLKMHLSCVTVCKEYQGFFPLALGVLPALAAACCCFVLTALLCRSCSSVLPAAGCVRYCGISDSE